MGFIRSSVRLNASITQGMRFFLIENQIEKWLGKAIKVENKLKGIYHLKLEDQGLFWESQTTILEKDFEKCIKFDMMSPETQKSNLVEVYFMPCKSKTNYCTEIHVMHYGLTDEEKVFFQGFWQRKLNDLRQLCNGDWVIEDRDLSLSALRSSF